MNIINSHTTCMVVHSHMQTCPDVKNTYLLNRRFYSELINSCSAPCQGGARSTNTEISVGICIRHMYIRVQLVFVHAHAVLYIIFILHQTLEMEQVLVIDELPVK